MGCCSSFARVLLIIFNFIFWLSGAALLGIGIWVLVDPEIKDYQEVISDATDDEEFLNIAAYILIAFGAFVFLVGFCGCCGAIRSSKCLIGFYIFFLVLVFLGEIAAGVYVVIYKDDAQDKLDNGLTKSIQEHYEEGSSIASAWDVVQKELDCCGGQGAVDYVNSEYSNTTGNAVPQSCCVLADNGAPVNYTRCKNLDSGYYNNQGCLNEMKDWIDDHSTILIGVGFGIAGLQLIGLLCAVCFCRHMDKDKYDSN